MTRNKAGRLLFCPVFEIPSWRWRAAGRVPSGGYRAKAGPSQQVRLEAVRMDRRWSVEAGLPWMKCG